MAIIDSGYVACGVDVFDARRRLAVDHDGAVVLEVAILREVHVGAQAARLSFESKNVVVEADLLTLVAWPLKHSPGAILVEERRADWGAASEQ